MFNVELLFLIVLFCCLWAFFVFHVHERVATLLQELMQLLIY